MPKEKSVNPVTSHAKSLKAKQIRKNKTAVAAQRTERLAKRNPDRLAKQIDDLENAAQSGNLKESEKRRLEEMKRDLGRVRKARERLGVESHRAGSGGREEIGSGVLGKRGRDGERKRFNGRDGAGGQGEESSDTDPEVRSIPMPLDTENMPPVPRRRRRPPRGARSQEEYPEADQLATTKTSAPAPQQTVYQSAPQIRNLVQESTSRFVPSSVRTGKPSAVSVNSSTGGGVLPEPEDLDDMEAERERARERLQRQRIDDDARMKHGDYARTSAVRITGTGSGSGDQGLLRAVTEPTVGTENLARIAATEAAAEAEKEVEYTLMAMEAEMGKAEGPEEEEKRFERAIRRVEVEEVEDEDL